MNRIVKLMVLLVGVAVLAAVVHPALAASHFPKDSSGLPIHAPTPWEWWLQPAASPIEHTVNWLMQFVLWIMFGVVLLVGLLIGVAVYRFHESRNKVPSTRTHHALIEVIWTLVPAILLVVIFVPSLHLIYQEADTKNPYMTVKVTGHQWYWEYGYNGTQVSYTSYPVPPSQIKPGEIKQLSVDHPLVIPVGKKVVFDITSGDVLHSFYIPSLGVQKYAIPGQFWKQWTQISEPGVYYGECNQICGMNHDNMPIEIVALPMAQFQAWLAKAKAGAAGGDVPSVHPYEVLAANTITGRGPNASPFASH